MALELKLASKHGLFNDREFFSRFIRIAIPVSLQYFMAASLNLTDNIMVGQLGDASIAAVGLANQVYFILNLVLFGLSGGISIFISQFWGSKNYDNIRKITALGLIMAFIASLVFFIPAFFATRQVLSIFSSDVEVIALGSTFLKTVCFSYIMMAFSICFASALRSTGNIRLPLIANITGLIVNTALNYILIFGRLGLPEMGVAGSATATVIARLVELLLLLYFIYTKNNIAAARLHDLLSVHSGLVKRFFATSGAVILKDTIWAVGTALYIVIYAHIGTEAVASVNIVSTIRQLAFVFFGGVSNACLIMVGNKIGADDTDAAYSYARRFLKMTLAAGVIIGGLIILARPLVLSPYHVSDLVKQNATSILIVTGSLMAIQTFNTVMIVGAMRSGGDVKYSIILDIVTVWVVGMPLALIGAYLFKLGIVWVFLMTNLQEVYKFICCMKRYFSRKWINNVVHGI